MIIRFATKTNKNGWQHQLEVDFDKKQYKYGSFLFSSADVNNMAKQQLDDMVVALMGNGFERNRCPILVEE